MCFLIWFLILINYSILLMPYLICFNRFVGMFIVRYFHLFFIMFFLFVFYFGLNGFFQIDKMFHSQEISLFNLDCFLGCLYSVSIFLRGIRFGINFLLLHCHFIRFRIIIIGLLYQKIIIL